MLSCLDVREISLIVGWEWDHFICVVCPQSSAERKQKNKACLKLPGCIAKEIIKSEIQPGQLKY